jgi:hypothetical protein
VALHCLRVTDGSPVAGQIEPFFDYLVGVDKEAFEDPSSLGRILKERDGMLSLNVYNAKSQRIRGMHLPYHAHVDVPVASGILGLSLRACDPANALESVYHVLDVLEGSPAEASLP